MAKTIPLPFESTCIDTVDKYCEMAFTVTFTEDFGKFKKGEKVSALLIDWEGGVLEAQNDKGRTYKKQLFGMTPLKKGAT